MADQEAPKRKRLAWSALEIAEQVAQVRDWLSHGKRPNDVRRLCSETWGLNGRVAESRMQQARRSAVADLEKINRQDLAAQALETLLKVQEMSLDTRQGSNAIGATRLMLELAGILGRSA